MNNTDFFVSPLRPVDFISIFKSINILSNIFYHENLLTENDQFKPIPVVNSLCEYLYKTNNSELATVALVQKLLADTDFYGANENEQFHIAYADAMLDHFVASVVFSKYGNTFGYLAAVVNATTNLTLSFVKRKIVQDLGKKLFLNQDYTFSTLTPLSVERITEKLIFPLFPELSERSEIRIIDVDYIYAQAGLMFTRSAQINSRNFSFEEYITMSQSIEQAVRLGQLNHTALKIFQLPALLYNVHKNREIFKYARFDLVINDHDFWTDVFSRLFSDLDAMRKNITSIQKTNPVYHFEQALFKYKNRTEYAEYLIRRMCPNLAESDYGTEIENYKNNPAEYHCKVDNFHLPDINVLFSQQNEFIANLYSYMEIAMIKEVFTEKMIKFIEQTNVTVFPVEIYHKRRCGFRCEPFRERIGSDTIVFQISVSGTNPVLYALILRNNNVFLESAENNRNLFMEKIGLHPTTKLRVPPLAKPHKNYNENFGKFLKNLVEPRRLLFYNHLQTVGYESTTKESIVGFFENFIPFHNCIKTAKTETTVITICACLVDSLVLIPLVGQATHTGLKFFSAAVRPLLKFRTSMKAFTIGEFVGITFRNLAAQTATEFSKLLTKELFKDLGVSVIRTLDPGIEFSYTLGKAGVKAVVSCFKIIGRKVTSFTELIKSLNTVKQSVVSQAGTFQGHNVFVSSISGQDGYGIKHFTFQAKRVYLRRLRGYKKEVPVVLVSDARKHEKIYQVINLDTGELKTKRWIENAEGILEVKTQPLRVRLKTIKVEGLSGRGRIVNAERAKNYFLLLGRREECVEILKTFMDENVANEIVRHYVFEDAGGRSFTEFANEWKLTNILPEWSSRYRIENVQLYEKLRYNNFVEESLTEDVALQRVKDLYGENYVSSVSLVNPSLLFQYFRLNMLYSSISFQDLYSFANLMTNRFPNINLDSHEALYMRKAICRIALRQIDYNDIESPAIFYKLESKTAEQLSGLVSGKYLDITKFTVFNQDLPSVSELSSLNLNHDGSVDTKVVFQATVNDPFLVINPEYLLPLEKKEVLFLPNSRFLIESIESITLSENPVMLIKLTSEKMSKSKWIAHFMDIIRELEEHEAQLIS